MLMRTNAEPMNPAPPVTTILMIDYRLHFMIRGAAPTCAAFPVVVDLRVVVRDPPFVRGF